MNTPKCEAVQAFARSGNEGTATIEAHIGSRTLLHGMDPLHCGAVLVVVGLLPLGGARGLLDQLCPLTVWEQDLRRIAGEVGYRESFIEHWLSRLLYWEAPWWVFVAAYTGFALLVGLAWWSVRPNGGRRV